MSKDEAKGITREGLETRVIELLQEHSKDNSRPIAIGINGNWGVGKSYMYRESLAVKIQEVLGQEPIYTSVFGKKDENAIIQDLVVQFLKKENLKINKMKPVADVMFKLLSRFIPLSVEVDTSFIFNRFEKKDLHNTIVCIDDFERLSDKIPMQDILGLISELKENKGCHIILLCSEDHINANQKDTFYHYKEKIIDFDFFYNPTPMEQLRILENTEEYKRYLGKMISLSSEDYPSIDFVLNYFRVTNIREIRKLIFCFNSYCKELRDIIADAKQDSELVTNFLNFIFAMITSARIFYLCEKNKKFFDELKPILNKKREIIPTNPISISIGLNESMSPLEKMQQKYKRDLFNAVKNWYLLDAKEQEQLYAYKQAFTFFDNNIIAKQNETKEVAMKCIKVLKTTKARLLEYENRFKLKQRPRTLS